MPYQSVGNSTPALKKSFNVYSQNDSQYRLFNEKSQNLAKSVMQNAQKEMFQNEMSYSMNDQNTMMQKKATGNYSILDGSEIGTGMYKNVHKHDQNESGYVYTNPLKDENFYKSSHNFGTMYQSNNNETRFSNNSNAQVNKTSLPERNSMYQRDSRPNYGMNMSHMDNSRSNMNNYNKSPTPLSKPTPMANRDMMNKKTPSRNMTNKSSNMSKMPIVGSNDDIFSRKMGFLTSNDSDYEKSINEIGADPNEFKKWVTYHIKSFIASALIPSILSENHKNINNINNLIMHFGKKLKESELFEKDYNPHQRQSFSRNADFNLFNNSQNYPSQNSSQFNKNDYESISIDHLLDAKNKVDSLRSEWGSVWKLKTEMKTIGDLNELTKNLNKEILRRRYLDSLLNIIDYDLKNTRSYIFSRLISLSENGFFNEDQKNYEAPRGKPADREIILFSFIFFVIENNFYYRKGISIDNIILKQNFNWIKKEANSFYIRQTPGNKYNYVCYSGETELSCLYGDLNIYCIIVFFLFHMKTKQIKNIAGPENQLLWILEKFNISKGEVMVG